MTYREQPLVFPVAGEHVLGIAALPESPGDCGVLIAVGGPQYRVGSHRQFLLLSRRLAAEGYSVFRFDYRGMGDSEGSLRSFENVSEDIGAAIDAFQTLCPGIRRFVLWGLCDAASAILMYMQAKRDDRIGGLALLNPWVRSEASLAQTHIKHYYGQRLMQREFWLKLVSGKLRLLDSVREFVRSARKARQSPEKADRVLSFQDRMADGFRQFRGSILLILSGQDYTAREFIEFTDTNAAWSGLVEAAKVSRMDVPDADHTFSSADLRKKAEEITLAWLKAHCSTQKP